MKKLKLLLTVFLLVFLCSVPISASETTFADVEKGSWYEESVNWAVVHNVTAGTGSTTFSPDATCTRGQMVTFLWRAAGAPVDGSSANPFNDIKNSDYFYNAVLWAVKNNITYGTSSTTFSPNDTVTRSQVVTLLWRVDGSKAVNSSNPFTDVKAGEFYSDAVLWAVNNEITAGISPTLFAPLNGCTRSQIVTFLYRSYGHSEAGAVRENVKEATCTENGSYDNVVYCSVCHVELSREKITVPVKGHTEVLDKAVEATCTKTGLTEGKHCSVCGTVLVKQESIPEKGHNYENGACTRCGDPDQSVTDDKISIVGGKVTAKPGDKGVTVAVSVKNNPGIMGMTLTLTYDDSVMTLVDAEKGEAINMLDMTPSKTLGNGCRFTWDCVEIEKEDIHDGEILVLTFDVKNDAPEGEYDIVLSYDDGDIIDGDFTPLNISMISGSLILSKGDVHIHNMTKHDAKSANCTDSGNSAYWSCSNCQNFYSDANGSTMIQENSWLISPLGHSYKDGKCIRCGELDPNEDDDEIALVGSKVTAKPGDKGVTVAVSVKNNPGIMGMTLTLTYDDSVMTLVNAENGKAINMLDMTPSKTLGNGCRFTWDCVEIEEENIHDGEILVLTFDVKNDAPEGEYDIVLSYDDGDIIDGKFDPINFVMKNGLLTVKK